ncbi:MAG: hypothetical protein ABIP54_01920 [Candidatus Andersenbacteria bacterium]
MKKKKIIALVGLIIVILLVVFFLKYLERPASFTVVSSPTPPIPTPDTTWSLYTGKHFSVEYPHAAVVYTKQDEDVVNNPSLQEFWKFNQDDLKMIFVAEILDKPDLLYLNEFPAVQLRRNQSDIYTEQSVAVSGLSGLRFTKHGSMGGLYSEQSVFFMVGHFVFSFVLTAVDEKKAAPIFDRMVASLRNLH